MMTDVSTVQNLDLAGAAALTFTPFDKDPNGNNIIWGKPGLNRLFGYAGNDWIIGERGGDTLDGGSGDDTLDGFAGADSLFGGSGNDTLNGGAGADSLFGGTGNDTYIVDNIQDRVIERVNSGIDTVKSSVNYGLRNNVENLTLVGTANIEGQGNALNNLIIGNRGDNTLNGGLGKDTLIGGAGEDFLTGSAGADLLTGGEGNDTFSFVTLKDSLMSSFNVITDYASGDRIDAVASVNAGVPMTLSASIGQASGLSDFEIAAVLTSDTFAANSAVAFTVAGQSGTFVAFNDATAGFQSANDSIVQLQNYTIGGGNTISIV
jgi:Ca2+-binding RTX toxin-like protein